MSDDALEAATWIPRRLRDVMLRTLEKSGRQARALLPLALATGTVAGVEFWNELCVSILTKDTERRFSDELLRHAIQGLRERNFKTAASRIWIADSSSAGVVARERLKRRVLRAAAASNPMAVRTWEGWRLPVVQALPALAEMPR